MPFWCSRGGWQCQQQPVVHVSWPDVRSGMAAGRSAGHQSDIRRHHAKHPKQTDSLCKWCAPKFRGQIGGRTPDFPLHILSHESPLTLHSQGSGHSNQNAIIRDWDLLWLWPCHFEQGTRPAIVWTGPNQLHFDTGLEGTGKGSLLPEARMSKVIIFRPFVAFSPVLSYYIPN